MSAVKSSKQKWARGRPWYIQIINIAKQKLDMDEDIYRAALMELTGKDSLKLMTTPELVKVLSFMQEKGFKIRPSRKAPVKKFSPKTEDKKPELKTQVDKLRAIWVAMASQGFVKNGGDDGLTNWAREASKKYNKGQAIDSLDWMNGYVADRLIESLKSWHKRLLLKSVPPLFWSVCEFFKQMNEQDRGALLLIQNKVMDRLDTVGHNALSPAYDTLFELHQKYSGGAAL